MNSTMKCLLAVVLAAAVTGCTTLDPQTRERRPNRAGTGAAIGAASGALIGGLAGDDVKAAAIGAGVGAIAGAAVGSYMDKQERALRDDLSGTGVDVQREGDQIALRMPAGITFDTGQAAIKPQFYPILDDIGGTLSQYESTIVHIAGHTDSTGAADYNQQLSVNRARSVRDYLIGQGIVSERIHTTGYGETVPIASNETAAGRAQNRRVEIRLQPLTK